MEEQMMPNATPQVSVKVNKKPKWLPWVIIAAAAITVLAIVAGIVINSLSPQTIAERYVEANEFQDVCAKQKYLVYDYYAELISDDYIDEEEYFEQQSDYFDEDVFSWKELSKVKREYWTERFGDAYGDYEITFEATKTKDISIRKLKDLCEDRINVLENEGLIDRDDFADAKVVTVKMKIEGEDETKRYVYDVYMVRCGLLWKVLDHDIVG